MRVSTVLGAILVLVGCSDQHEATPIIGGEYREATQILALTVASCNADLSSELVETTTSVRITVKAKDGDPQADCADGIDLHLDHPLGDRQVVDDHTGEVVSVVIDQ